MKKLLSYIKQSDVIVTLYLNPLKWWKIYAYKVTESQSDPGLILDAVLRVGPIKICVYIDDERW